MRRALDVVAVLLIVAGIFGLVRGGITFTTDRHDAELGPFEMSVQEKETVAIAPIAGGLMVVGGLVLLSRRKLGRSA